MCGIVNIADLSSKTFEIRSVTSVGTSNISSSFSASNLSTHSIEWTVTPINQQVPAPVFTDITNSLEKRVSSQTSNIEICSGYVQNQTQPSTVVNHDDCIGSIQVATGGVPGANTILFFDTPYAETPNCIVSAFDWSNGNNASCFIGQTSTVLNSSPDFVRVTCESKTTAANFNFNYYFVCVGKR